MRKLIVSLPHWNSFIPENLKPFLLEEEKTLHHIDLGTEQLFDFPGAETVKAKVSRYVVDLNRARYNFKEKGVFIRKDWDNNENWKKNLSDDEKQAILARYYDSYYIRLNQAIEGNEKILLIDGHSMGAAGTPNSIDENGKERPDIDLGCFGFRACDEKIVNRLKEILSSKGYWVEIDKPYRGGRIVFNFGIAGVKDALAVEINKRLYMDEKTLELFPDKIEKIRNDLLEAINQVLEMD